MGEVLGKSVPRVDGAVKVTGQAKFGVDIRLPRMLHAKTLKSPLAHAKILHIDISRAQRLPGVRAVVTGVDAPDITYGIRIADETILAKDKVRFIGEDVAAVAAIDEDIAAEAIELIRVDYEELPSLFDPVEAMKPGAPNIHEIDNNIAYRVAWERGDVGRAIAGAYLVLEDTFSSHLVHQGYLEPVSCVADFDASGRLSLWFATQNPFGLRAQIAKALAMNEGDVRVILPAVGGAFGGKDDPLIAPLTALLAKRANRPVRLCQTREDTFSSTRPRAPMVIRLKMAASRDGTLLAKDVNVIADNGAYSSWGPLVLVSACNRIDALYRIPNLKAEGYLVYTNKVPSGAYRGFGNTQSTFAVESMMDMIAEKLGMDVAELKLKNASQTGDVNPHGWKIQSCGLNESIEKAVEMSGWKEKRLSEEPTHGTGMGSTIHISGVSYEFSRAVVKIEPDGRVNLASGESDVGEGAYTTLAQIAAEELGARFEDVSLTPVDTSSSPYTAGATFASRVTISGGNAAKAAAADARRQLFAIAAEKLEANIDDLEAKGSRVYVKGSPEKSASFAELVQKGPFRVESGPIVGEGSFLFNEQIDWRTHYGNSSPAYSYATQVAEIKVDADTGQISLINFVSAHDTGRTINPMAAEGQIEGAVAQAIGYSLTENMILDTGRVVNPNFRDYKIATALDMPPIRPIFVESNDPVGPFGAKGMAEPPINPTAPAIANAIYQALGIRIKALPLTPEIILKALREKDRS